MNWELIAWIGAGILLSEILFILIYKYELTDSWVSAKFAGLFISGAITFLHSILVFGMTEDVTYAGIPNYMYLLWEAVVIGGIVLLFWANKQLVKWIDKNEDKE